MECPFYTRLRIRRETSGRKMARLWRDGVLSRDRTQRTLTAEDSVNTGLSRFVSPC